MDGMEGENGGVPQQTPQGFQPVAQQGAPQYAPQYAGYQPYQPRPQGPQITDMLKNPIYLGLGLGISIFLIWLGVLLTIVGMFNASQGNGVFEAGLILYTLGMSALSLMLFFIGLGRGDYPQWVRTALVAGAVVVAIWGIGGMFIIMGSIMKAPYTATYGSLILP